MRDLKRVSMMGNGAPISGVKKVGTSYGGGAPVSVVGPTKKLSNGGRGGPVTTSKGGVGMPKG